jgi:16S rRNA (cytosine967-C5)-methyltransferase
VSRPVGAREVARRVLARVERDGAWATLALDGELGRSGLDGRDRRLTTELVYGVLRHRTRIDRALAALADLGRTPPMVLLALRVAAYQLLFLRVPAHAAVDDAVGAVRASSTKLAGFTNAVLRKLSSVGEPALPPPGLERIVVEHSLPRWIVDQLALAVAADGGDAATVAAAAAGLSTPAPLWVRVNPTRARADQVAAALVEEGAEVVASDQLAGALAVTGLGDPAASPSFRAGWWTVQDLGAQQVVALAAPLGAGPVLDACAGVGGKATQLAELAGPEVSIDAVDLAAGKLELAAASARRLGLGNVRTVVGDLRAPGLALAAAYPVVVLDAPCTGLGVLRRHPEAKWRLVPADVDRMAALQHELLAAVAPRVAPGGVLVYSVCSVTVTEGEAQVERFLAEQPAFVAEPVGPGRAALRTWPHAGGADGFFAARLRRR